MLKEFDVEAARELLLSPCEGDTVRAVYLDELSEALSSACDTIERFAIRFEKLHKERDELRELGHEYASNPDTEFRRLKGGEIVAKILVMK